LFILVIIIALILVVSPLVFQKFVGQNHEPYDLIENTDIWLKKDEDKDGLSDLAEQWSGTDPQVPDTDHDGMTDGVEYQYWKNREDENPEYAPTGDIDGDGNSNINDIDSDFDGLKDGWEVSNNYDPAKRDSDGDGIADFFEVHPVEGDHNNNGMPDAWERKYGISDPKADPDNDGISNEMEYAFRQNPLRPGSGTIEGMDSNIGGLEDASPLSKEENIFRTDNLESARYWRLKSYSDFTYNTWYTSEPDLISAEDLESTLSDYSTFGFETHQVEFYGLNLGYLPSPLYPADIYNLNGENDIENDTFTIDSEFNLKTSQNIYSCTLSVSTPDYTLDDLKEDDSPDSSSNWGLNNKIYYSLNYNAYDLSEITDSMNTGNATSFEKIGSILEYLYDEHVYSHETASIFNEFLYDNQSGNSFHFSTAFILLARSMDIPARLVVGFANGELERGYRTFDQGQFHAWAEVFFEDIGWVGVECTAARESLPSSMNRRCDGSDPWILQGSGSSSEFVLELGGSGGTAFETSYLDYSDIVRLENLDSDRDGITNANDDDDDNDGLSDSLELDLGSNPIVSDTDYDGLNDGEEYNTYNTDLLDRDTDGDGIMDGPEVSVHNTDPNELDSDGGAASDGAEVLYETDPLDPSDDSWAVDEDGDGLTDGYENNIGSDPEESDTDEGGVGDFWEVYYGSDPLDPDDDSYHMDSDGDGLSDGRELDIGSDPHDWDTDGGGAGDWLEYRYGGNLTDWFDDDDFSDSDGDGLINSYEEDIGTSKYNSDSDYGGLSDYYEDLYGLDPLDSSDDFVEDSDFDNDGLNDYDENFVHNTDPLDADSDNDGLTDLEEINLGTDPLDSDSDGDYVSDGLEVAWGSNPNRRDTDGDGLMDGEEYGQSGYYWGEISLDNFESWASDPTLADSDGDGLSDYDEIDFNTNPMLPDSDGDGFSDYWEWKNSWNPNEMDVIPPEDIENLYPDYTPNPDVFDHSPDFDEPPASLPDNEDFTPRTNTDFNIDTPDISAPASVPVNSDLLIVFLLGALVLVGIIVYWYYLKRTYKNELKDVFKKAIRELVSCKGEPKGIRESIIHTYKNTLHILEKYNFLKPKSDTPREFATAFNKALPDSGKYLNDITDVFEEARYSDHQMKEKHRKKALRCFRSLYNELNIEKQNDESTATASNSAIS